MTAICEDFENILDQNKIVVVGADFCPACVKAKNLLKKGNFKHLDFNVSGEYEGMIMQECIFPKTRSNFIPQVFVNKKFIGGFSELRYLVELKKLDEYKL